DHRQLGGPFQVVLDYGPGRAGVELDEPLELALDPLGPVDDHLGGVECALAAVPGVADHAGGPAGEHDGPVPGELEAAEGEQRDEVAGLQARRGRVEARVEGDDATVQACAQRAGVGAVLDQASPAQLVENVLGHGWLSSRKRSRALDGIVLRALFLAAPAAATVLADRG